MEPKKNIYDAIRAGDYESKLEYPQGKQREGARKAYNKDQARLEARFRADLLEHLGLTGHPEADRLYALAWEHGHYAGYHEVAIYAEEFAELVK